jgi:hypothetical protein
MIAKRIEFIDIESPIIGGMKPLVHLDVENFESQALRFTDLVRFRSDLDLELRHVVRG